MIKKLSTHNDYYVSNSKYEKILNELSYTTELPAELLELCDNKFTPWDLIMQAAYIFTGLDSYKYQLSQEGLIELFFTYKANHTHVGMANLLKLKKRNYQYLYKRICDLEKSSYPYCISVGIGLRLALLLDDDVTEVLDSLLKRMQINLNYTQPDSYNELCWEV